MKALYTWIIYPESSPIEDFVTWLNIQGYNYRISPLHDKDVYEEDNEKLGHVKGALKKPHYHVMVGWENNPPSKTAVKKLAKESFKDISTQIEDCYDGEASERYQAHEDNPEKAQYNPADAIISEFWNVADYESKTERKKRIKKQESEDALLKLLKIVDDKGIVEYCVFIQTICNEYPDLVKDIKPNNQVLKPYIDSKRFSNDTKKEEKDETETLRVEVETLTALNDSLKKRLVNEMYWRLSERGLIHGDAEKAIVSVLSDVWRNAEFSPAPVVERMLEKWKKLQGGEKND